MSAGRLVNRETGEEVAIGSTIKSFRDEEYILRGFRKPHKPSSTGRVFVKRPDADENEFEESFFPGVFDLEIVDYD